MGKIRVATLGDEDAEKQQAAEAKKRREVKKAKKAEDTPESQNEAKKEDTADAQLEKSASSDEKKSDQKKEVKKTSQEKDADNTISPAEGTVEEAEAKAVRPQLRRVRVTGKNTKAARKKIDKTKVYPLADAVKLVQDMSFAKFDETVEVHLNLRESVRGEVQLPHGTGKKLNVAIVDDKVLKKIEAGDIDFDVLIASPSTMSKVVPFARVLGPKGLMPNPKNGTVAEDPKEAAEKFKGGSINFKSEPKAHIIHQTVGKVSFKPAQLVENVETFMKAVGMKNIRTAFISASMTPSVQVEVTK